MAQHTARLRCHPRPRSLPNATCRPLAPLRRRHVDGHWALHPAEAGQTVVFDSMGLSLPIEALYEDVDLQAGRATGHP